MNPEKLSVIVITSNEERNIAGCLGTVSWADEIVVVDSTSSDRTAELAREFTDRVFVTEWMGYAAAKDYAVRQTRNEWVLWLDADERVPAELASEIRALLASPQPDPAGYEVARRAYFLGRWIRHCGWYPGYVVRLFQKSRARFSDSQVHERLVVDGPVGRLHHDLDHYTDETLHHYFGKFNRYTTLAAEDAVESGRRFSLTDVLFRPPFLFFKMYVLRLGFLDGVHGLILSLLSAAYVFSKYAKIWDLRRQKE